MRGRNQLKECNVKLWQEPQFFTRLEDERFIPVNICSDHPEKCPVWANDSTSWWEKTTPEKNHVREVLWPKHSGSVGPNRGRPVLLSLWDTRSVTRSQRHPAAVPSQQQRQHLFLYSLILLKSSCLQTVDVIHMQSCCWCLRTEVCSKIKRSRQRRWSITIM